MARLWNDYVSQIATRKDKPPSATLFSSKDGRGASKAEISSMVGQHGAEKAGRHLSTKTDVMLDMVLICIGQSKGRRRGSTQNCQMKERIPHHKTSSNYRHVPPGTLLLRD